MSTPYRSRHRLAILTLFVAATLIPAPATSQSPAPNIVHLQGDDWGWPYYGFMQRYIAAKISGTCEGGARAGEPCTTHGECPGSVCASEYVGDDPTRGKLEYKDRELFLPEVTDPSRPPVHRLITPALDWLAEHGNFWPISHNSASASQPAFAIIMTGLYPEDYVLTAKDPRRTPSPVLPEWLPASYLTLGAGKWQFAVSHATPDGADKRPWDREVGQGGNAGEGGRIILRPYFSLDRDNRDHHALALQGLALERIKDFIACARCTDRTKCLQPPATDARPDKPRLTARANPDDPDTCQPQPFYVLFSPFIPHIAYRFDENCPFFPRDAEQCQTEPWKSHSLYCADTSFDWSCANYAQTLAAALPISGPKKVNYLKHINTFDRAVDELIVHLKCPLGGRPDCGEDLFSNTVLLHRADHGWELLLSKGKFTEHAYRTPTVLYDPRPGTRLPTSPAGCANQEGCRSEFVHAVDVRATIADLSGSTFECDGSCPPCDPTCPNACPCPRPDGRSRYSEGQSLRSPPSRPCASADPAYRQCIFGREKGSQGIAHLRKGWYVLAEVRDAENLIHLCKLYRSCGKPLRLYDLRSDPNERDNLTKVPAAFCAGRMTELVDVLREAITDKGWYESCFDENLF
jgi:arylsulfatase A-like enzyme